MVVVGLALAVYVVGRAGPEFRLRLADPLVRQPLHNARFVKRTGILDAVVTGVVVLWVHAVIVVGAVEAVVALHAVPVDTIALNKTTAEAVSFSKACTFLQDFVLSSKVVEFSDSRKVSLPHVHRAQGTAWRPFA